MKNLDSKEIKDVVGGLIAGPIYPVLTAIAIAVGALSSGGTSACNSQGKDNDE